MTEGFFLDFHGLLEAYVYVVSFADFWFQNQILEVPFVPILVIEILSMLIVSSVKKMNKMAKNKPKNEHQTSLLPSVTLIDSWLSLLDLSRVTHIHTLSSSESCSEAIGICQWPLLDSWQSIKMLRNVF